MDCPLFVSSHLRCTDSLLAGCLYVYRRDGKLPSEKEVLKLLAKSGELDKVWAPTETELEKYGLAPGFCVRFKFYQDSVEAIMVGSSAS